MLSLDKYGGVVRQVVGSVDWGFTNPGVLQVWAVDGDARLYCVRQVYKTRMTIDWWIEKAKELQEHFGVEVWVADPSEPAYIQQFNTAGLMTIPAFNDVGPGIQAVAQRLVVAADGRPRLVFLRDSIEERDPLLVDRKLPASTEEEFDAYVWNLTSGRKKGEEPVKQNDHGLDATRYLVAYVDSLTPGYAAPASFVTDARDMW